MEGSGKMLVIAVGEHSQTGLICNLLRSPIHTSRIRIFLVVLIIMKNLILENELTDKIKQKTNDETHTNRNKDKERSILQTKLTKLAIQIGYIGMSYKSLKYNLINSIGMLVAILTVLVLIARFSWEEFVEKRQPWKAKYWNRFVRYLITGITVLVVAVPEGLPLAVTISLAYAVKVSR